MRLEITYKNHVINEEFRNLMQHHVEKYEGYDVLPQGINFVSVITF